MFLRVKALLGVFEMVRVRCGDVDNVDVIVIDKLIVGAIRDDIVARLTRSPHIFDERLSRLE